MTWALEAKDTASVPVLGLPVQAPTPRNHSGDPLRAFLASGLCVKVWGPLEW